MMGSAGFTYFCVILGVGLVALPGMAVWIWMIVDCATHEPDAGNTKLVWIIIIVFGHFIGALIYLIVRRPERKRLVGQ